MSIEKIKRNEEMRSSYCLLFFRFSTTHETFYSQSSGISLPTNSISYYF